VPPLLLSLLLLGGCGTDTAPGAEPGTAAASKAVSAIDDRGREVRLARPAQRVVSLLPAATETFFALGAGAQVVGRTRYDTDAAHAHLPSVGGGLDPSLEALLALRPDLVIAFETAGGSALREQIEALGIAVFAIAPQDTADVFANIVRLGRLTGRDAAADSLAGTLRAELAAVRASVAGRARPRVFYVVGDDPPMTAGPESFVIQLLSLAGGETIFPELGAHWPQISLEEVVRRAPDVVVLPVGEGGAERASRLRAAHGWRQVAAVRAGRIVTVSADLAHRPGPSIAAAARAFRDALHPDLADD
jgi:iron complex transport system substrate-binding protein